MANVVSRLARGVAHLPRRLLASAGWSHMEPTGLGVGAVHTGDADEMEAERRRERETRRREKDEDRPAKSS